MRRIAGRLAPFAGGAIAAACVATRALHFTTPSLPPAVDDRLGDLMALHFSVALNQGASFILLVQAGGILLAAAGLRRLVRRLRRRPLPAPRLLPLGPWTTAWLWLGLALGNTVLDFQPDLLKLLVCTTPILAWVAIAVPRRGTAAVAIALTVVVTAAWLASRVQPDRFDAVYGGAWLVTCAAAIVTRPYLPSTRDWVTGVALAYAGLQGSTLAYDRLPLFRPDPDATAIADGVVFHWCENTARGLLYATHTSCDVWTLDRCRDDFIAVHDLRDPRRIERLRFFDAGFAGRMMHLLCLPDRVQVGMAATLIDGRLRAGNLMEFRIDDAAHPTRDVLGDASDDGTGAIFLHDRARNAVFYVSESHNRVLRVDLATGERRWITLQSIRSWPEPHRRGRFLLSLPAPTSTGRDAVYDARGSGFFVEWMLGSKVVELDLARGDEIAVYRTNNGGNQAVAVDEERARLLVTGVWGLEAFDLRSGQRIARVRTPFGPRLPIVDATHDLVFVPTTFGNHVLVLDRDDLRILGRLAVGTGGRFAHLTADGTRLFASGGGRTWMWETATIGRRFGRAR